MIKMLILIPRRADMSYTEFREYYEDTHGPLSSDLPNLRKYVIDFPTDPERTPYDAVAELYFDSMADLRAAFDSDVGEKVQADAANFIDSEDRRTMIVEESIQLSAR